MQSHDAIEFVRLWDTLHNPDFNPRIRGRVKSHADPNAFILKTLARNYSRKLCGMNM